MMSRLVQKLRLNRRWEKRKRNSRTALTPKKARRPLSTLSAGGISHLLPTCHRPLAALQGAVRSQGKGQVSGIYQLLRNFSLCHRIMTKLKATRQRQN